MKKVSAAGSWAKEKTKNGGSRIGSRNDPNREIEKLIAGRRWKLARARLNEELIYAPADHWLWMSLSLTYYEQKEYENALQCGKRAVELAPNCPLALWHYAGCLYMTHEEKAAFAIWTLILNTDLEEIAYDECGEGMDWAMRLVNDVQYRVGRYHLWNDDHEQARVSFEKYLHNRAHGVSSTYDEVEVRKLLQKLS